MQVLRANIHKILCGALVALALATLPLPALADNEAQQPEVITENVSTNKDAADKPVVDAGTPTKTTAPTPVEETTTESDTKPISDKPATSQVQADQSPNASGKVQNDVNSSATSGSATVAENEKANDALSGDATATSTTINVANTNGANAGSFQTFECNITEDRDSDILIDPMALPGFCQSTIAGSSAQPSASGQGLQTGANLTEILNNIVLSATSGDATVNGNETAGNATSGNATALANVLNIANTNIDAKNSFLGVVNIYADLKGDILVPQSFVDGLANGSSAQSSGDMTTNITNAINASATSGEALAADNGTVGNTTSGEAMTSLTVLNLTGQEVIARNSLLVFINVLGKWMGMIVPAPGSANKSGTAMLGSGLQGSGSVTQPSAAKSTANTTTNITNNISVATKSGDASITDNEKAGNATSGKAAAGVNLLNITNSNFRLDDWFGALFK